MIPRPLGICLFIVFMVIIYDIFVWGVIFQGWSSAIENYFIEIFTDIEPTWKNP